MIRADNVNVFLSCSFRDKDAHVNDLVRGVCNALGVSCLNVSTGYSSIPSEQARTYIAKSAGLIAIATQRDRLDNGGFTLSSAVHEEISIAYGMNKPILILGEEGVRFDGLMNNYGTRLPFAAKDFTSARFIEKLVSAIYNFKQELLESADLWGRLYATEYFAESIRLLTMLELREGSPMWTSSLTRRLRFEAPFGREIKTSVWSGMSMKIDQNEGPGEWDVRVHDGSRDFVIDTTVHVLRADRFDAALRIVPPPRSGDFIEFSRVFRSKYLNPLSIHDFQDQLPPPLVVGEVQYFAHDGFVALERTEKLRLLYSFPVSCGIGSKDVAAFVASHSFGIDYVVPQEVNRVACKVEAFGTHLLVDINVEFPLPRHMYGLAWRLPDQP